MQNKILPCHCARRTVSFSRPSFSPHGLTSLFELSPHEMAAGLTTRQRAGSPGSPEEDSSPGDECDAPSVGSCRESASAGATAAAAGAPHRGKTSSDLSIIVHPAFVHLCASPPEIFCPLDWLPDEVISNVLVHLVRLPTRATCYYSTVQSENHPYLTDRKGTRIPTYVKCI